MRHNNKITDLNPLHSCWRAQAISLTSPVRKWILLVCLECVSLQINGCSLVRVPCSKIKLRFVVTLRNWLAELVCLVTFSSLKTSHIIKPSDTGVAERKRASAAQFAYAAQQECKVHLIPGSNFPWEQPEPLWSHLCPSRAQITDKTADSTRVCLWQFCGVNYALRSTWKTLLQTWCFGLSTNFRCEISNWDSLHGDTQTEDREINYHDTQI